MIARGVRRLLRARGFSSVTELPLTDGRRADIVAVNRDGEVLIVEIKSSPADFRADRKWRDYAACCDRLYFAISERTPADLDARGGGPHRGRSLRRGNRAGGRTAAHGPGQPAGAVAALRPGRRRPAASSGRSGSHARTLIGKRRSAERTARNRLRFAQVYRQKKRAALRRPFDRFGDGSDQIASARTLCVPAERGVAQASKAEGHHRPSRGLRNRRAKAELERIARRGEIDCRESAKACDRHPLVGERIGMRAVSVRSVHRHQVRTGQRIAINGDGKRVDITGARGPGLTGVDRPPIDAEARLGGAKDNLFRSATFNGHIGRCLSERRGGDARRGSDRDARGPTHQTPHIGADREVVLTSCFTGEVRWICRTRLQGNHRSGACRSVRANQVNPVVINKILRIVKFP